LSKDEMIHWELYEMRDDFSPWTMANYCWGCQSNEKQQIKIILKIHLAAHEIENDTSLKSQDSILEVEYFMKI